VLNSCSQSLEEVILKLALMALAFSGYKRPTGKVDLMVDLMIEDFFYLIVISITKYYGIIISKANRRE